MNDPLNLPTQPMEDQAEIIMWRWIQCQPNGAMALENQRAREDLIHTMLRAAFLRAANDGYFGAVQVAAGVR